MRAVARFYPLVVILLPLLIPMTALGAQETGARYLAITADIFYDDTKPLVAWKNLKGMRSKLVKLSETGASAAEIRDYIVNACNNWTIRPEYILFVGAPNFLPMPYHGGAYTDNYYTDIDGDLLNDVLSGRLTVRTNTEAKNVVNKILHYERWPDTTDRSWFTRSCLIANTDGDWYSDSIYWDDVHHYARLMTDTGFTRIDTLSNTYGNGSWDVINAVNDGRNFVLYRGCGVSNWYPPFACDPSQSQNGYRMPIVLSVTCATLGTGSTPAAAERWFLTGTDADPRGAAGYFATTTCLVNGAHYRSAICQGFGDALFIDGERTFGRACESGRKRVWSVWGNATEYRGYHAVGDPEMNLWISAPRRTAVDHPAVVMPGSNEIDVTVTADGLPCPGATVCLVQDDTLIYRVELTGPDGIAHLSCSVVLPDPISITVTGPGLYPYENQILVSLSGSYVAYLRHEIADSAAGNNNRRLNPGETADLPVWVKNYGIDTASGITAVLQPLDTNIAVLDSIAAYPDLAPGDSEAGAPRFRVRAADGVTDGQPLGLRLTCRSADDTTFSEFTIRAYAPRIDFIGCLVTGGNGNGIVDPGETVGVAVTLKNNGRETAADLCAVLRCASTHVTVIDSSADFGSVLPDSTAANPADPYIIWADSATPVGTNIQLELSIRADGYADTCRFRLIVGKEQFLIWNPDYSPEPGQAMYSLLGGLGYSGDYCTALPADLSLYASVFVCAGVFPNNYLIADGSPEASSLAGFCADGGCLYLEGGDVWYWDPIAGGYDFCPLFGIVACDDGIDNLGPVAGDQGTFTRDMYFDYGGENQWMDHITAASGSAVIFRDVNDGFDCGVAHDAGSYRTVGLSFELGGLVDAGGVSTRRALLDSIMRYFGMNHAVAEGSRRPDQALPSLSVYPNPFRKKVNIIFSIEHWTKGIELRIYDATGRLVRALPFPSDLCPMPHATSWSGEDQEGRTVPPGVYFIRAVIPGYTVTRKIVLVR